MHSAGVVAISLIFAATSVFGMHPPVGLTLSLLAIAVAVIGVPHGGLDHWTGKRLLSHRFPRRWLAIFLTAYLAVALGIVGGWSFAPIATIIFFFLASAWHFGNEDGVGPSSNQIGSALSMVATGGLVIWIPLLARPAELEGILTHLFGGDTGTAVGAIVLLQPIAAVAVFVAIGVTVRRWIDGNRNAASRDIAFSAMFAVTDVLVSFGVYFCGWHSLRGLKRLAAENDLSYRQLARCTAPMSLVAVAAIASGLLYYSRLQTVSAATIRVLFVGLSAIAVPHLLLHSPLTGFLLRALPDASASGRSQTGRLA